MNEQQIIEAALNALKNNVNLEGKWTPIDQKPDAEFDGHLQFTKNKNGNFFVEVKKEIRPIHLPRIFEQAKKHHPFFVVAESIFPNVKKALKEKGIGYLDGAGNMWVQNENFIVLLEGHKPLEPTKFATNRAFTKAGLKTVFYLLLHDDAINLPYRQLALKTKTALGNINNVLEGLKEAGYILALNKDHWKIVNKKALLQRWITAYGEVLRPTLLLGKYRLPENAQKPNWRQLQTEPNVTVWGGEPAADILINYMEPQDYIVYTNNLPALRKTWRLLPFPNGYIHVYKKFWEPNDNEYETMAPMILIYADLILTGDPRCIETAGMIFEKYLKDEFK